MQEQKKSLLIWLNIVAFISTLIVDALAEGTTIIGGKTTAQVSTQYASFLTPPGYIFAILGVTYALLAVFIVFQVLPAYRKRKFHKDISYLFIFSSVLNTAWLFLWQNSFIALSIIPMLLLLISLGTIYFRLSRDISRTRLTEWLSVKVPFTIYFGWISVVTLANIAAVVVSVGLNGFGVFAEALIIVATLILFTFTLFLMLKKSEVVYALVILLALTGVAFNTEQNYTVMVSASLVSIMIVASIAIIEVKDAL